MKLLEISVGNTQIENINYLRPERKLTNTLVGCREGEATTGGMIVRESMSQLNLILKYCMIRFERGILRLSSMKHNALLSTVTVTLLLVI